MQVQGVIFSGAESRLDDLVDKVFSQPVEVFPTDAQIAEAANQHEASLTPVQRVLNKFTIEHFGE